MNISDKGLQALINREGKRNKAYLDTKGIPTNGVGHTKDVKIGDVWTDQKVFDTLREDLVWVEAVLQNYVSVPLNQSQYDALCSFIFNIGGTAFIKSTMLVLLNKGDYLGAAKQFDRWIIPPEITKRRMSEKQQFLQT